MRRRGSNRTPAESAAPLRAHLPLVIAGSAIPGGGAGPTDRRRDADAVHLDGRRSKSPVPTERRDVDFRFEPVRGNLVAKKPKQKKIRKEVEGSERPRWLLGGRFDADVVQPSTPSAWIFFSRAAAVAPFALRLAISERNPVNSLEICIE